MPHALLVNGTHARTKQVALKDLFASMGGLKKNDALENPRKKNRKKHKKAKRNENPLVTNRPRDAKGRFKKAKGNPLVTNRQKGKGKHNRKHNPLVTNRARDSRGRFLARHNPLIANPGNGIFDMLSGFSSQLAKIPVIGSVLAPAVIGIGSAAFGAVGVVPIHYGLKYTSKWIPARAKPFAFTLVSLLVAGIVKAFVPKEFPYKDALVPAIAGSGGAIDMYRALTHRSANLGDEYGDTDGEIDGEIDGEDLGDEYGDDGNTRPGEWGEASVMDYAYAGDDLSDEEMAYADLGRRAYRRRFWKPPGQVGRGQQGQEGEEGEQGQESGASEHAGKPGGRWGWLIFWIGFDNFKAMARYDRARRQQVIAKARQGAREAAQNALQTGVTGGDVSMEALDAAGLLAR